MDAYRVEEITRYAASAPRKPAKVIMELLENRREIQAAVVRLIGERDTALALAERRAEEIAGLYYLIREARDAVPHGSDIYNELIDALAALPD